MAQVTINTTARQDKAVKAMSDQYNLTNPDAPLTPVQWAKAQLDSLFNRWADMFEISERESKASLYQKATPADQAAVDAILAKYL